MPVESKHKDLKKMARKYVLIDDVLEGSERVKGKSVTYLPPPNGVDYKGAAKDDRYLAYLQRAVFYAVARHTLDGFAGEIFTSPPAVKLTPGVQALEIDASGDGVSLNQLAKKAVRFTLGFGRAGVFVDFPTRQTPDAAAIGEGDAPAPVTLDQVGDNQPIITVYDALKIINWRTKRFGSKTLLCLVVLEEKYVAKDDGFEETEKKRYRVLRLSDDRKYSVQLYEDNVAREAIFPTKGDGANFDYIPFLFIGSETNDATVDYPPLFDLCDLNLAHYRNSADYEESAFLVGQPTPVFTGLTEQWVDKYFGDGIVFGSRTSIPLPTGATADLLTATENTMIKEAMDKKEQQMVALGAKLVENKSVQRTATEVGVDAVSEKSVLSTVADNVSQAFTQALICAADYVNGQGEIEYKLNNEFSINLGTSEAANNAVSLWTQQAISFTEMRMVARKAGYATQPDAEAKKEIQTDGEAAIANEVSRMTALAEADPNNDPNNPNNPDNPPSE